MGAKTPAEKVAVHGLQTWSEVRPAVHDLENALRWGFREGAISYRVCVWGFKSHVSKPQQIVMNIESLCLGF